MTKLLGSKCLLAGLIICVGWLVVSPKAGQAADPPAKYKVMIGEWECQAVGYEYRIKIDWDKTKDVFKATLTKNVPASENYGFETGEHVWTGIPVSEPNTFVELQKWRYGANGVTTKIEWKLAEVDIKKSTTDELVISAGKFTRVK